MIDYEDNLLIIFRWNGSVVPKAFIFALPAALVSIFLSYLDDISPTARKDYGLLDITESQIWNAMTAVIAILLGFRTRQALGRFWEGTSLLHQMRGEWFDAASCLITFSRDGKLKNKAAEVQEFRHTLIRLMSLMHGSALDEISGNDEDRYEVLDIHGLDTTTLRFLRDCKDKYGFNRVEALQHMIQVLVTHNHHAGVLTIPPPILSRIYQTLSRGLVNLLNARKIKDTMFPFPYAQIILTLLLVHTLFTPLLMTQIVASKVWSSLLSFFPIFGMWCLNFTAGELEMPFGSDQNDLPLCHFQTEMNETLLMLIHEFADHLPHTSNHAVKSFDILANYARASVVRRGGSAHSDSKSFLRSDFFDDKDLDEVMGTRTDESETQKEPKAEQKINQMEAAQPKAEVKAPEAKAEVAPAPAPAPSPPPAAPAATPPAPAAPVAVEPLPLLSGSVVVESQPESKEFKEDLQLQTQMQQSQWRDKRPDRGSGFCLCVSDDSKQVDINELRSQLTPRVDAAVLPSHLSKICEQLLAKTEVQVQELKVNTDIMRSFNAAFPKALREHSQIVQNFSESILRTIEANSELLVRSGPPTSKTVES